MQQYDNLKTKRRARLIISYIAMTVAVIAISTICVLLVMGYRFNFTSNKVEQGALLQVGSSPGNANIVLDGEEFSFVTPGKRDIDVGVHDLRIYKKGYRDWSKQFSVKAGEVRWLNYARLVPTTVVTQAVMEFPSIAAELPSPDRKHFAVLAKADTPELTLVNVSDSKNVKSTKQLLPDSVLTKPAGVPHGYALVEWNLGSKYLLVRHDFGDKREYIRVNIEDAKDVVNLSTKFGLSISEMHFSSDSVFYGLENGNIRRLDLAASSLSEPLVKDVVAMRLYGSSDLAYIKHTTNRYEVGVVVGDSKRVVNSYDDTVPILIDLNRYFNEYYLAITRGASFELVKNPEKSVEGGMSKVVTLSFPGDLKWLDMSSNGRVVIAGSGSQLMIYDIELAKRSDTNFPGTLADPTLKPVWLDNMLLASSADNKLRISDFDGDNQQIITDCFPGLPASFSADDTLLYSFSKSESGKVSLQASKMITN